MIAAAEFRSPLRLTPLILTVLAGAACQPNSPKLAQSARPAITDSLAAISERFFTAQRVPGLAVGVMQGGAVIYRAGFGTTILGAGQPVTPATLFHLASVTKPFVATAIMQLVEQGKVGLDQPVRQYLPYFSIKKEPKSGITIRQLLTHTAGMPDVTDYRWDHPEYDAGALERYIRGLADSSLIFAPTEKFAYSNIGFEVLADLIAKVSHQPFEDYLQDHILKPLGMAKSTLLMTDIDSALMASGHSTDSAGAYHLNAAYPYNRRHAASSTLHSNIDDMLRWGNANLKQGTLDGATILTPSSYGEMWKLHRDMTAELAERAKKAGVKMPYQQIGVGLSWFLQTLDGHQIVSHSGGDNGFRTNLELIPDQQIAIVVLTNGDGADPEELSTELRRVVLAAKR